MDITTYTFLIALNLSKAIRSTTKENTVALCGLMPDASFRTIGVILVGCQKVLGLSSEGGTDFMPVTTPTL
jgi:hypothetical protein